MHEGHRKRLREKLANGDNLYEHELLEILLFNAYPRVNVNPVAHNLLERFAGVKEVLSASVDELCAVSGVGPSVALYLKCVGECLALCNDCESFALIRNTSDLKTFLSARFRGKSYELLEFYFLDKNGRVRRICSYTNHDADRVDVQTDEVLKLLAVYKPYGVYIAHNHVNSPAVPSAADDAFTKRIQLACSISNVRLYDHCIYVDDNEVFSYFMTNRLDKIVKEFSVGNLIDR